MDRVQKSQTHTPARLLHSVLMAASTSPLIYQTHVVTGRAEGKGVSMADLRWHRKMPVKEAK